MTEIVKASFENGVQKIRITADKGYHPAHIQLQKGVPAEIIFHRVTPSNCYKEILFEKEGKSFVYSALLTLDQSRDLLVQDIKDKVCSRRIKNLLADLIAECDFTLADLEDLEAVISEKKSSAVREVRCNCM